MYSVAYDDKSESVSQSVRYWSVFPSSKVLNSKTDKPPADQDLINEDKKKLKCKKHETEVTKRLFTQTFWIDLVSGSL